MPLFNEIEMSLHLTSEIATELDYESVIGANNN